MGSKVSEKRKWEWGVNGGREYISKLIGLLVKLEMRQGFHSAAVCTQTCTYGVHGCISVQPPSCSPAAAPVTKGHTAERWMRGALLTSVSKRWVVERHLPVLIHLSARISALRRFLSLDREERGKWRRIKRCLFAWSLCCGSKWFDWRNSVVLTFSNIRILICLWKMLKLSSQSNLILPHVLFRITELSPIHPQPSGDFQAWPTLACNGSLLLPHLRARRQHWAWKDVFRACLHACKEGTYIRTDRCVIKGTEPALKRHHQCPRKALGS